ncbi:MAG TPA: toxin-antitoxin system YwqK family antitoxin, partial [Rhabdochlamydiaceae bacterium]|nr:toxin-antitoxin system YwqK family antitoxin [Rhabdochlamydiaceae bacterium]
MRILTLFVLVFSIFSLVGAAENSVPRTHPRQQEPHWKAKIEERHPSGQPSKIVFYEEIGDAAAVAVKLIAYYPSGQVKMEADVTSKRDEEGKLVLIPIGVEISLDERNNVEKVANYADGVLDGEMRLFYPTGQVKATCQFKKGKRHGAALVYHLEGGKAEEAQYEEDKIVGDFVKYYAKGGKAALVSYAAGMPHGKGTEWYENGALKALRHYENGVLDSDGKNPAVVIYSEDHAMIEVQDYRRGEPIGTHVKYHPNGKESYKMAYKEGKKDGKELYYSADGKLTGEGEYKEGIPMGKHWRSHDNGQQGFLAIYDDKGNLLQPIEEWNESGQKVAQYSIKNNKFDGSFKQWSNEGKIINDLNYVVGDMEGPQKECYPSGQVKRQGFYQ